MKVKSAASPYSFFLHVCTWWSFGCDKLFSTMTSHSMFTTQHQSLAEMHTADTGSIPWCSKRFFSQSQLSVQTLLSCSYNLHGQSRVLKSKHTSKIPKRWQPYHCLDAQKYTLGQPCKMECCCVSGKKNGKPSLKLFVPPPPPMGVLPP